ADAIILDPDRVDFYNGMGLALYRKKSYPAALRVFTAATELDPNDAISRYNEACVLALMGRPDESFNLLSEAVSLDPRLAATAKLDNDFATINTTSK
ncbi:tetratricopeptide repeat protein, partial [Glaesserella parasuis]|uniref:tetratricopeptide repeat protein n=1 Tax=Glaesserella parasuis TaxID=738 RepID=UPI003F2E1847